MKKTIWMASMIMCLLVAGQASGNIYEYTPTGGGDIADWTVEGSGWTGWSTATTGSNWVQISYTWSSDGAGGGTRSAFTWTAPENEYIVSVAYNFSYNADITNFAPAVYTMGAEESLSGATPIVWSGVGAGYMSGSNTLNFTEEDNLQKIGLGLNVPRWGYIGYLTQYSNMVITTESIPEPMTMLIVSIGGIMVVGGKFRKKA